MLHQGQERDLTVEGHKFHPSEGTGLRDPFRADNDEFIYLWVCDDAQCPGHAPPLAFPHGIMKVGEDL